MDNLNLKLIGRDSWDRPVYQDDSGKLWKDTDPLSWKEPNLCSSLANAFDGEPDVAMHDMSKYKGANIVFVPKRDVWR